MSELALEGQLSGTVRLYDIDFEAARNNEIIGNRLSKREDALGKWNPSEVNLAIYDTLYRILKLFMYKA